MRFIKFYRRHFSISLTLARYLHRTFWPCAATPHSASVLASACECTALTSPPISQMITYKRKAEGGGRARPAKRAKRKAGRTKLGKYGNGKRRRFRVLRDDGEGTEHVTVDFEVLHTAFKKYRRAKYRVYKLDEQTGAPRTAWEFKCAISIAKACKGKHTKREAEAFENSKRGAGGSSNVKLAMQKQTAKYLVRFFHRADYLSPSRHVRLRLLRAVALNIKPYDDADESQWAVPLPEIAAAAEGEPATEPGHLFGHIVLSRAGGTGHYRLHSQPAVTTALTQHPQVLEVLEHKTGRLVAVAVRVEGGGMALVPASVLAPNSESLASIERVLTDGVLASVDRCILLKGDRGKVIASMLSAARTVLMEDLAWALLKLPRDMDAEDRRRFACSERARAKRVPTLQREHASEDVQGLLAAAWQGLGGSVLDETACIDESGAFDFCVDVGKVPAEADAPRVWCDSAVEALSTAPFEKRSSSSGAPESSCWVCGRGIRAAGKTLGPVCAKLVKNAIELAPGIDEDEKRRLLDLAKSDPDRFQVSSAPLRGSLHAQPLTSTPHPSIDVCMSSQIRGIHRAGRCQGGDRYGRGSALGARAPGGWRRRV